MAAGKVVGREIAEEEAKAAIMAAAGQMKAEARRMSRESAKSVNRHLSGADRKTEPELELEVDKWFDSLDLTSLDVIQCIFPGKELLKKTLEYLNGEAKEITRGHIIGAMNSEFIAKDSRLYHQ